MPQPATLPRYRGRGLKADGGLSFTGDSNDAMTARNPAMRGSGLSVTSLCRPAGRAQLSGSGRLSPLGPKHRLRTSW